MHERDLGIAEAAVALGVSQDTLRRWERNGKLATTRDGIGHRRIAASEIERLLRHARAMPSITSGANKLVVVAQRLAPGVPVTAIVNVTEVSIERSG